MKRFNEHQSSRSAVTRKRIEKAARMIEPPHAIARERKRENANNADVGYASNTVKNVV